MLATDDNAVASVNFLVDGLIRETTQSSPYDFEWDTDLFADGQLHALQATAIDAAGNIGSSSVITVAVPEPIITINISNQLNQDIEISINQGSAEEINGGASSTFIIDPVSNVRVDWELIPLLVGNDPIGDPMSGFWDIDDPGDEINLEVDYIVGDGSNATFFFNPVIDNESSTRLLMGVNWGLQSENRCNCVVPGNSDNVSLGYYLLFSNTEVRGYDEDNGCDAGGFVFWDDFADNVQDGSGTITLSNTTTLTNIGVGGTIESRSRSAAPDKGLPDQPH